MNTPLKTKKVINRKLATHEQLMWLLELTAPYNIQAIVRFSGNITLKNIKTALKLLQEQHPYLRTCIKKGPTPSFSPTNARIPCRVIQRKSTIDWQEVAIVESKKSTIVANKPMFRLVWLKGKSSHELIFTLNHMIIDGITTAFLVKNFFQLCAELAIPKNKPLLKQYLARPNIEKLLPVKVVSSIAKLPPAKRLRHNKYTATIMHKFSVQTTKSIIDAAKKNNCTVQGLLCAAFMLTEYKVNYPQDTDKKLISSFSPLNMRPYLTKQLANEELSNYVTALEVAKEINDVEPFWPLAKYVSQTLKKAIANNAHVDSILVWRDLIKQQNTPKEILKVLEKMQQHPTIAVSNLGIIDMPSRFQQFTIKDLIIYANLPLLWNKYLAVLYTFQNQLIINFCYVSPTISKVQAKYYKDTMLQILNDYVRKRI